MQAVAGQLAGLGVVAQLASPHALSDEVADEIQQLLLGPGDVLAAVHHRGQFGAMGPVVGYLRVGGEHGLEPPGGGACGLVPDLGEVFEVAGDVALVPGGQDRLDVGEVLVQGRAAYARLGGDPRHRDRRQPVLGDQGCGGIQGRVMHRPAVLLDRLVPQLRHSPSLHDARPSTL